MVVDSRPAHLKTIEEIKNVEIFFFATKHDINDLELSRCILVDDFTVVIWSYKVGQTNIEKKNVFCTDSLAISVLWEF